MNPHVMLFSVPPRFSGMHGIENTPPNSGLCAFTRTRDSEAVSIQDAELGAGVQVATAWLEPSRNRRRAEAKRAKSAQIFW